MQLPNDPPRQSLQISPTWFVVCICLGTVLGIALHNLGLWLSLGVVFGICGGNLQFAGQAMLKRFRGK